MRLVIKRWYEAPPPGERYASPYKAHALLELTAEEAELVAKYDLGGYVLTRSKYSMTTLNDVVKGSNEFVSDIGLAVGNEQVLRDACAGLPAIFDYCRSFGSDLTFEYLS
jgi:hypothetical protein